MSYFDCTQSNSGQAPIKSGFQTIQNQNGQSELEYPLPKIVCKFFELYLIKQKIGLWTLAFDLLSTIQQLNLLQIYSLYKNRLFLCQSTGIRGWNQLTSLTFHFYEPPDFFHFFKKKSFPSCTSSQRTPIPFLTKACYALNLPRVSVTIMMMAQSLQKK